MATVTTMKKYLRFLIIPIGILAILAWIANILTHNWDGLVILGSATIGSFWLYVWITWFF